MGLKLITAPVSEPITAANIRSKLGLDAATPSDADLNALIAGARMWAEQYCQRSFLAQTWEKRLDAFPEAIELAMPPVQSITTVKYIDPDGALQTLANTEYALDEFTEPGWVFPAFGKAWPSTREEPNAVRVQFVTGYSTCPQDIINAIVLIVGQATRQQPGIEAGIYPTSVPNAAKELLAPYRIMRL